jgi:hypothetical protein
MIRRIFIFIALIVTTSFGNYVNVDISEQDILDKMTVDDISSTTWIRPDGKTGICGGYKYGEDENDENNGKYNYNVVYLNSFDFDKGTYTCSYVNTGADQTSIPTVKYYIPNYKKALYHAVEGSVHSLSFNPASGNPFGVTLNGLNKNSIYTKYVKNINFSTSLLDFSFNGPDAANTLEISNAVRELTDSFDFKNMVGWFESLNIGKKGEQNDRISMSKLFLGIILLDENFIRGVDKWRNLRLTPHVQENLDYSDASYLNKPLTSIRTAGEDTNYQSGASSILTNLMGSLTGVMGEQVSDVISGKTFADITSNSDYFLMSDMFKNGPLSLYVSIFATLMEGFEYIAYTLLLFASLYYIGTTVSQASISKLFPDKSSQNASIISSPKIAALAGTFVVAFLTINSNVYYYPTITKDHDYNDMVTVTDDKEYIKTTFAKNLITSAGMKGDELATFVADNMYLTYLEYKSNKMIENIRDLVIEGDKKTKELALKLKIKSEFYNEACFKAYRGSAFRSYNNEYEKINTSLDQIWRRSDMANNLFQPAQGKGKGATEDNGIVKYGPNKEEVDLVYFVKPELCSKIASELNTMASELNNLASGTEKLTANIGAKQLTNPFKSFIKSRIFAQYNFGWFNVISVPFMHSFFDILGKLAFHLEDVDNNTDDTKAQRAVKQQLLFEEKGSKSNLDEMDNTHKALKSLTNNMPYLIMPGFKSMYGAVRSSLMGKGDGKFDQKSIESLKRFLEGVFTAFDKKITDDADVLYVTAKLYDIQVQMLFTAIVSIFVLIKVVFWLFDALKYFFISPFAVFWGIAKNNTQNALGQFVTRGFVLLMVKPMLIVMTVILFIISFDLFTLLYDISIANILNTADIANQFTQNMSIKGNVLSNSSDAIIALTGALNSLFKLILNLVLVFVGYKMVMDGDNWVLNVLGYQDQAISKNDMAAVASDLRMKLQST